MKTRKRLPRIAVLISGRGSNLNALLCATKPQGDLYDLCEIAVVISNTENALGLQYAAQLGIPACSLLSKNKTKKLFEEELLEVLSGYSIDIILLAGFMQILSPFFVQAYAGKILNIHPADTALYRGARGYEWAFMHKQEQTFITVHLVDEGVDTGKVLSRTPVDLKGAMNLTEVITRGLATEHAVYPKTVRNYLMEFYPCVA